MKTRSVLLGLIITINLWVSAFAQQAIDSLLSTSPGQEVLIDRIGHDHEFMMKLMNRLSERPHFVQIMQARLNAKDSSSTSSPYIGQGERSIKTLSEADIKGYESGEGMGLAKAAELHGYPGPRHVLDLASRLQLAEETRRRITEVYNTMHAEAVRLGKMIVDRERNLDELFTTKVIRGKVLTKTLTEIGRLQSKLRDTHLRAHLATALLLTPAQIHSYNVLRGYDRSPLQNDQHGMK